MAEKKITRRLSIYINGQEVDATITNLRKNLAKFRSAANRATEGSEDWKKYNKIVAELEVELHKATESQKDFRKEMKLSEKGIDDSTAALTDFTGHLSGLYQAFKKGDALAVQENFKAIKAGISGATSAALKFIATPLGATITILAGIGIAAKKWLDYNKEVAKATRLTQQITDLSGKELEEYRARVSATAETFDKEFNEVLITANALAKQMKISQSEALDLINQGFVRGADVQGEFLDKVKEYPIQFKNAGYSAQDFIDIATQEAKGGIYSDKLLDAIKEADLALKEMTNTQKEALSNAFGEQFANELADGLKSGEVTTKEAINKIIKEADRIGLNFQQQQQLVADVFKGAGEDAGGFAEIILQINGAFDENGKKLDENEKATQRLTEANQEYEKQLADLFDASQSGFPAMLTNLKAISTEIFTNILRGVQLMFTSIEQLKEQAADEGQKKALKDVTDYAVAAAKEINGVKKVTNKEIEESANFLIENTVKNIDRLKKEIDDTGFLGKISGKNAALQSKLAENEAYLKSLRAIAAGETKTLREYVDNLEKEQQTTTNTTGGGSGLTDEQKKKLEAQKKYQDEVLKLSKSLIEQENIEYEERLKKAGLFGRDKATLSERELAVLEALQAEHQAKLTKINLDASKKALADQQAQYERGKRQRQTQFNEELVRISSIEEAKDQLRDTLSQEELDQIKTLQDAKAALQRQFEAQELEKQMEFLKTQLAQFQSVFAQNAISEALGVGSILSDEQKEALLANLEEGRAKLAELGLELSNLKGNKGGGETDGFGENMESGVDIFGFTTDQWEAMFLNLKNGKFGVEEITQAVGALTNMWNTYNQIASANENARLKEYENNVKKKNKALKEQLDKRQISEEEYNEQVEKNEAELAKKKHDIAVKQYRREKTIATLNTIANTAVAIMRAYSDLGPIGGTVAAAVIGTLGALQLRQIQNQPEPVMESYEDGGFTFGGPSSGGVDGRGGRLSVLHPEEYVVPKVVRQDPEVPAIIDYLEQKRVSKLGSYENGGPVAPITTTESSSTTNMDLKSTLDTLNNILSKGIMAKLFYGLEDEQRRQELEDLLNKTIEASKK